MFSIFTTGIIFYIILKEHIINKNEAVKPTLLAETPMTNTIKEESNSKVYIQQFTDGSYCRVYPALKYSFGGELITIIEEAKSCYGERYQLAFREIYRKEALETLDREIAKLTKEQEEREASRRVSLVPKQTEFAQVLDNLFSNQTRNTGGSIYSNFKRKFMKNSLQKEKIETNIATLNQVPALITKNFVYLGSRFALKSPTSFIALDLNQQDFRAEHIISSIIAEDSHYFKGIPSAITKDLMNVQDTNTDASLIKNKTTLDFQPTLQNEKPENLHNGGNVQRLIQFYESFSRTKQVHLQTLVQDHNGSPTTVNEAAKDPTTETILSGLIKDKDQDFMMNLTSFTLFKDTKSSFVLKDSTTLDIMNTTWLTIQEMLPKLQDIMTRIRFKDLLIVDKIVKEEFYILQDCGVDYKGISIPIILSKDLLVLIEKFKHLTLKVLIVSDQKPLKKQKEFKKLILYEDAIIY